MVVTLIHQIEFIFRAISVLLGDKWKKLKNEERKAFAQQAKQLAEQYRKQNPDCWKRKRSISEVGKTSQTGAWLFNIVMM